MSNDDQSAKNEAIAVFARAAEQSLGRPLSKLELRVAEGYGLMARIVIPFVESKTPSEVEEFFEPHLAPFRPDPLNQLARGKNALREEWNAFVKDLPKPQRDILTTWNVTRQIEIFSEWFMNVLRVNPPPSGAKTLFFGLHERRDAGCFIAALAGRTLNTVGSSKPPGWDAPQELFPIEPQFEVWNKLQAIDQKAWYSMLAIAIVQVRAFFLNSASEFSRITGIRDVRVVVGWPGGDPYRLRF